MDFLAAIDDRQGTTITLGGQEIFIERKRLGGHLQLLRLSARFSQAETPAVLADLMRQYLIVAGVPGIESLSILDTLTAYLALTALNGWKWVLPWLKPPPKPPGAREIDHKSPPYNYAGRNWAIWIHKIAQAYGWARDQILRLWPEEAAAYVQEILLSEYEEAEDRRALSELSYRYDKGSNTMHFIPRPRPYWMVDNELPKSIRVRKDMLPVGNVIDLN